MGFDLTLFDAQDRVLERLELPEALHDAIFSAGGLWGSYAHLRRMSDYYAGRVVYAGDALVGLREDWDRYRMFVPEGLRGEYDAVGARLGAPGVAVVTAEGD